MRINWNASHGEVEIESNHKKSLFGEQLTKISTLCKNLSENIDSDSKGKKQDIGYTKNSSESTVIGVVGERGSGKSSVMASAKNMLTEEGFLVIGPIDPSIFDDSLSILELFLSSIFNIIKNDCQDFIDKSENTKIYSELKKALKTLGNMRRTDDKYIENNTTVEVMLDYHARLNFKKQLEDIINLTLKICKEQDICQMGRIVVCIDDLDMVENDRIYQMTEDIRKYLSGSAIVLLSYREQQLNDAITHKKIVENKELLEKNMVSKSEIATQVSKYLEKLTPHTQQVYLPKEEELYNKKLSDLLQDLIESDDDNESITKEKFLNSKFSFSANVTSPIKDWVFKSLEYLLRLNLKPNDASENQKGIYPTNLRGLLTLIEVISQIHEKNSFEDTSSTKEISTNIQKNIIDYREYLHNYAFSVLSTDDYTLITSWETHEPEEKNYFVYRTLSERLRDMVDLDEYGKIFLLPIRRMEPYNITLADVYDIFETYKSYVSSEENSNYSIKLIYFFKVFYSLLLTELYCSAYLDYYENSNGINSLPSFTSNNLEAYLKIINTRAIPESVFKGVNEGTSEKLLGEFRYYYPQLENDSNYNEVYITFLNKVVFSPLTAKGDVLKVARLTSENSISISDPRIYRYREVFSYEEIVPKKTDSKESSPQDNESSYSLINTRIYSYDPFVFMTKKTYIVDSFRAIRQGEEKLNYVIISLFDIDLFMRRNFTRHSEQNFNTLEYVAGAINRFVRKDDKYDLFLINPPILKQLKDGNNTSIQYNAPYKENRSLELDIIKDFDYSYLRNSLLDESIADTPKDFFIENLNDMAESYYWDHSTNSEIKAILDRLETKAKGARVYVRANERQFMRDLIEQINNGNVEEIKNDSDR